MAVRLRLMRMGKTKQPVYRVVVIDQRAPRDGRYIEQIGRYDARQEPSLVEIDNERAADWLAKGAQPSETVEKLLNISGALNTMKIKTGGIHVVGVEKDEAPTEAALESPETSDVTETDEPAASSDSETDAPGAGGGSEGGRPPSDKTEEE
jgi:small subunit ribosomal protein S16